VTQIIVAIVLDVALKSWRLRASSGGSGGVSLAAARPGSRTGARVALAPAGDSFVALPLAGPIVSRAGFSPAGLLHPARGRAVRPW